MALSNVDLAKAMLELADSLELNGDNPYRIKAYRKAAKSLFNYKTELSEMIKHNIKLSIIPGIGQKIESLLSESILKNDLSLFQLNNKIRIDPITIHRIDKQNSSKKRSPYRFHFVMPIIENLLSQIKNLSYVTYADIAGEYRRKCELINELLIIIATNNKKNVLEQLRYFSSFKSLSKKSNDYFVIKLNSGISISMMITEPKHFYFLLWLNTGSYKHIEHMQNLATAKRIKFTKTHLNKANKNILIKSESDIYHLLNLENIPPELREDKGEVEKARLHELPTLISLQDIKGNLHTHTVATDGIESLETMVEEAIKYGYEYLAITDHSQSLKITNGLNEKRLWEQIRLIDKLNNKLKGFTILKSIEVDILEDGSLDLPNSILKELDIRVCAIHSKFKLPKQVQTKRILKAMDNPYFNILAHPTGRLIKKREPYALDMEVIIKGACERNCFLEINSQPYRLDINDEYARKAQQMGVKISISTDAHSKVGFTYMQFGINQARRGWLKAEDVINTYSLFNLLKMIKR